MTFWSALRWAGTLLFVLIILVSWFGVDRNSSSDSRSDQKTRPAPIIIR